MRDIVCKACGNTFSVPVKGKRCYCDACREKYKNNIHYRLGVQQRRIQQRQVSCNLCGNTFDASGRQIQRGRKYYCEACRGNFTNTTREAEYRTRESKPRIFVCGLCGNEFDGRFRKRVNLKHFTYCDECRNKYGKGCWTIRTLVVCKERRSAITLLQRITDPCCCVCGAAASLEADHIIPKAMCRNELIRRYHADWNLQPLCKYHHKLKSAVDRIMIKHFQALVLAGGQYAW